MNTEAKLIMCLVTGWGIVGWMLAIVYHTRYTRLRRFLLEYIDAVHFEHALWKLACDTLMLGGYFGWAAQQKTLHETTNSTTPPSTASEEGNNGSDLESNTTAGGVRSGVPGNGI